MVVMYCCRVEPCGFVVRRDNAHGKGIIPSAAIFTGTDSVEEMLQSAWERQSAERAIVITHAAGLQLLHFHDGSRQARLRRDDIID
jgi:hypothetical protein